MAALLTPEHLLAAEDERAIAEEIMRATLALAALHESREHGGQPCLEQRASIIAYAAHHLGLTDEHLPLIAMAVASYDDAHEASQAPGDGL